MIEYWTLAILFLITITSYLFFNSKSKYWKKRNVPYVPPLPLVGNFKSLVFFNKSIAEIFGDLYNADEGSGCRFFGIHTFGNKPGLVVKDPELIKMIFVKDFKHFSDRISDCDEKRDPLGFNNLFVLKGLKWRYLRAKLTPIFTSGKIKKMFYLTKEAGCDLLDYMNGALEKNEKTNESSAIKEFKTLIAGFTVDVTSSCAFGINSNSFKKEKAEFKTFATKINDASIRRSVDWKVVFFAPFLAKWLRCVFFGKESSQFFRHVFQEAMKERESRKIFRNDFLDLLLELKNNQNEELKNNKAAGFEDETWKLEGDLLIAQSVLFMGAGYETSSTVISLTLFELAKQPHIQDKLREEILNRMEEDNGELTYEGIFNMKYLGMVVSESLRKYPPLPFLDRICVEDYKIPDSEVVIEKGTQIFIPLYNGLHYDEKYFSNPTKFDPERFTEESIKTRHPFSLLPFGEGPRSCLGTRFAYMTVKTGLCLILSKFKIEVCEKTKIPMELSPLTLTIASKEGLYLKFEKI